MLVLNCANCGDEFQAYPSAHRKYCSRNCALGACKTGALTHGMSRTRLYGIWSGMKSRCAGTTSTLAITYYQNKGITVCEEWSKFEAFRAWSLANGYQEDLQIDRIDNNGNYEPDNCRWVNFHQQMLNRGIRPGKTSRYRGVGKLPKGRWRAVGSKNTKPAHIGCFDTEEDAARAYDSWARKHNGEFAQLNF